MTVKHHYWSRQHCFQIWNLIQSLCLFYVLRFVLNTSSSIKRGKKDGGNRRWKKTGTSYDSFLALFKYYKHLHLQQI